MSDPRWAPASLDRIRALEERVERLERMILVLSEQADTRIETLDTLLARLNALTQRDLS